MFGLQDPVRNNQLGRREGGAIWWRKGIAYPDVEVEIPVRDGLDVKSYSRYRRNHLSNLYQYQYSDPLNLNSSGEGEASYLQSVQKGGLPGVVLEPRVSSLCKPGEQRGKCANTKPKIRIRISFFDHSNPDNQDMLAPIFAGRSWARSNLPFLFKEVSLSLRHLALSVASPCAALLILHKRAKFSPGKFLQRRPFLKARAMAAVRVAASSISFEIKLSLLCPALAKAGRCGGPHPGAAAPSTLAFFPA